MKRNSKNSIKAKALIFSISLMFCILSSSIGISLIATKIYVIDNEVIKEDEYPFSSCNCFSSSCDATITYTVSGPDENNNYQIHYKVTNNGKSKDINRIEVGHGPESTGTNTASAPNGWSSSGTKPENGDVGGMFFESSIGSAVGPGQTQQGFSWTVNSPNGEPTSNSALVWCRNSDGTGSELTFVNPEKDKAQTESKNCEDPEDHGFNRESSDGENGFEVIPDEYIHNEDCVIAIGDIIQTSDDEYFANIVSPVIDMSWHPTPEVQFTHNYNGWNGCSASIFVSSNSGTDWIEVLSFGKNCGPNEICSDGGRIILPVPQIGSSSNALVKWEFNYAPRPDGISSDEKAYWIIDDILILSGETPQYQGIIYVDDDNTQGPWDGSKEYPFNSIQDGIDAAYDWCIIKLEPGIYYSDDNADDWFMYFSNLGYEHITVLGDSINYYDSYNRTILEDDGKGSTIRIENDNVKISNLVIRNCGTNEEDAAFDIVSNNNVICNNIIENNQGTGVYLHDSANHNMIYGNNIRNNEGAGIFIWESSNNNYIFHNNFVNNGWYHAKDKCNNYWDYGYPSGGNYWDDYTGVDINGDGMGDTSYDILGDGIGNNRDRYPFLNENGWNVKPNRPVVYGPTSGKPGEKYEYLITSIDPNGDKLLFEIAYGDGTENELSKPCDGFISLEHIWEEEGSYTISARAIDLLGEEGDWSTFEISIPKTKTINPLISFIKTFFYQFEFLKYLFDFMYLVGN